ncbi:MAG: hypothetical protein A4E44_01812 [Methanosaeta sp. PtaB.Bin018]|nr:MAG: hypothetical protein A4E44_01812 [Methanosaeta sp. PtaB.Bin018]OPY47981.1 MAG: hypothetical protein A4E46_00160 [Methanosaeta sp. PtaU1.Bin016]
MPARPIAIMNNKTVRAKQEDLSSTGMTICAPRMSAIMRSTSPVLMPISIQFLFTDLASHGPSRYTFSF